MAFEPLAGWRHVEVTDRRTRRDFAGFIRWLVDGRYKDAEKIVLVSDQLNIHSIGSLYEAFEPAEASRLANRLRKYRDKLTTFLHEAEVDGTHNAATRLSSPKSERALRPAVVFRKITGLRRAQSSRGSRSTQGARAWSILASVMRGALSRGGLQGMLNDDC